VGYLERRRREEVNVGMDVRKANVYLAQKDKYETRALNTHPGGVGGEGGTKEWRWDKAVGGAGRICRMSI
jgi:hypothetical protein